MNILFVYDNLSIGGIQTLIVRLAERLSSCGHSVTLLLNRQGDSDLFARATKTCHVSVEKTWLNAPIRRKSRLQHVPDVLMAFDSISLLEAASLHRARFPQARVAVGVFHPREFCPHPCNDRLRYRLAARLLCSMPSQNILFMNDYCRAEHRLRLGKDLARSTVIPIPIDTQWLAATERTEIDREKLVSIGRLTPFKTYHRAMIPLIARLQAAGRRFHLNIYGSGPERASLQELIVAHDVPAAVALHGDIPYAQLPAAFRNAFAFIGMGTALVEASAAGVPSLVAVESSRTADTYGWFHDLDDLNTGENVTGRPALTMETCLTRLADDFARYDFHCRAAREKAARFSIDGIAGQYVEWLSQVTSFAPSLPSWFRPLDFAGTALTELGFAGSGCRYVKPEA